MGGRKAWNNLCGSGQLHEICIQLSNYRQTITLQRAHPGRELGAEFRFQKQRSQTAARILLQSGLSHNKHPYGPKHVGSRSTTTVGNVADVSRVSQ